MLVRGIARPIVFTPTRPKAGAILQVIYLLEGSVMGEFVFRVALMGEGLLERVKCGESWSLGQLQIPVC